MAPLTVMACGSSPTSPSPTHTPVQLSACATWANTLRGTGVAAATGAVVAQRDAFYAAGGGIRAVGSKYYAALFPSSWAAASPRRVMVGLHGTGGAPETEWSTDWKNILSQKGWGYLGLKYYDDATGSHDNETSIYSNIKAMLMDVAASCDFGSPSLFLVGFSRGSANGFPIAYLDIKDRKYFKAIGNNSGAWPPSGPLMGTMQGVVDRHETTGYAGTRFWMYCGALDMEPGFPMCDWMSNAKTWVTNYGGTVERLYQDPTGGHGGLAKNTDAWTSMFAYFESLR